MSGKAVSATGGVGERGERAEPRPVLERFGLFLRRHRLAVLALQWIVVLVYAFLVIVPAFMPLPPEDAHIWNNLRLYAQFAFWGVWWPGVMVATVLFGRVWCGLLCPEGALTEWVSKYGRGAPVPVWLKWAGWPFLAFAITTIYGQLVSVYEYPQAALLILGGSTLAAIVVGLLYGRGKRVWCRHLCPASGVFSLMARIAPMHYKVDRAAWDRRIVPIHPVNCAPLVDVRRMKSAAECHSCGRCAGQRDAVALTARSPFAEIVDLGTPARTPEALALLFCVLGIATAAFQWTVNPWFVRAKIAIAEWLVERDVFWPLSDDVPWWVLTHYPEANDVFTWLDGGLILAYLLFGGLLFGALAGLGPALAARCSKGGATWQRFSLALLPLGAASVVLGLSMLTVTQLKAEHVWLGWVTPARLALLTLGCGASLYASWRLVQSGPSSQGRMAAMLAMAWPVLLVAANWLVVFFVW